MTTKVITGSYPVGYYLNPAYQNLQVDAAATVGGYGVTTSSTQPTTISNFGQIVSGLTHQETHAIYLSDGGRITNQDANGVAGLIAALNPIRARRGRTTVVNAGTVRSLPFFNGQAYILQTSIVLVAGGFVSQAGPSALISNGVFIAGGSGTVVNRGTIGDKANDPIDAHYPTPSVILADGGMVFNGANSSYSATLLDGIYAAGHPTTVINDGTIDGATTLTKYGEVLVASIKFNVSGIVINGSNTDTAATITNGIDLIDKTVGAVTATIVNFGTIGDGYVWAAANRYASVRFTGAQISLTNGSADDAVADISNGIIDYGSAATITNFGTISSTDGGYRPEDAIQFRNPGGKLIEEGTGVLDGKIVGNNSTLVLDAAAGPGSIAAYDSVGAPGFTNIDVVKGAVWTVTNSGVVAGGATLSVSGSLSLAGPLSNHGDIFIDGSMGGAGMGNAGLIEKLAGPGTAIISSAVSNTGKIEARAGRIDLTKVVTGAGGILQIDQGAGLEFGASVGSGQSVLFTATTGSLVLDAAHAFAGTIESFVSGDKIDLAGFALKGATVSFTENAAKTSGVLSVTSGGNTASLTLTGDFTPTGFQLSPFSPAGLAVTYLPPAGGAASPMGLAQATAGFVPAGAATWSSVTTSPDMSRPPGLVHLP